MQIIKIGKEKTNDICFENDPTVSRNHCQIFVDDDGNIFLTDLNSTNGTFVNNNKISNPVILSKYDIVRAGNSLVNWKEFLKTSHVQPNKIHDLKPRFEESKKNIEFETSSKKLKWIFILILIFSIISIILYYTGNSPLNYDQLSEEEIEVRAEAEALKIAKLEENKRLLALQEAERIAEEEKRKAENERVYIRPQNGYSPYDKYFGKGVYANTTNSFIIKNSNYSDAVVLLVDAFSKKKIRNEYIRKGAEFEMSNVPNGTYYLEWFSGNDWSPNLRLGSNYKGGFRSDSSFTKTKDKEDWMKVGYVYESWTVTLYNVPNGDVESQKINANEFFK